MVVTPLIKCKKFLINLLKNTFYALNANFLKFTERFRLKRKKERSDVSRSCGALSKLDSTHDFASYIKRSPPPYEEDSKEGGSGIAQKKKDGKNTFDSKMKTKIKGTVGAIAKSISGKENEKEINEIISKLFNEADFPTDIKFYVLANGIFDDKIYTKGFSLRIPVIKHFIRNEGEKKSDEALYFFIVGLWDYLYTQDKREKTQNMYLVCCIIYMMRI